MATMACAVTIFPQVWFLPEIHKNIGNNLEINFYDCIIITLL